jgi:hypothetical protein
MAPLRNPRHERFVQALLEGKNGLDAYEAAGFKRDDGNAARLRRNPKVEERLAELQAEIAGQTKVTVESLIGELEQARLKATDLKQLSATIRAIEGKAKLAGLMVERQKIEISDGGSYDNCETAEDVAAVMVEGFFLSAECTHAVTEEDREHLIAIYVDALETMRRTMDEAAEKLREEIRSRPLGCVAYHSPPALPSPLNGK